MPSFKKSLIVEQFQGNYLNFWSILAFQLDHWLVGNMLYLELIKFPVGDQHRSLSVVIKASCCLTALVVKSFFC